MRILICLITGLMIASIYITTPAPGFASERVYLPSQAAIDAVENLLPGSEIDEIEYERRIIQLYDITVHVDGRVVEVSVTDDGTVLNIEEEVGMDQLPEAVARKLKELAQKGKLTEIERVEWHGELKATPLDQPRVEYEAELRIAGKEHLVRLTETGEDAMNPGGEQSDRSDDDG